jgi:hypothetical protein
MFKASETTLSPKTSMRSVAILALAGSAAAFAPMGTPPLRKVQIFLSYSAFFCAMPSSKTRALCNFLAAA